MRTSKIVGLIFGAFAVIIAFGLLVAGVGLLVASGTQRDADGYFTSSTFSLASEGHAITSEDIALDAGPWDTWPGDLLDVRIDVSASAAGEVFVGIGPTSDVDAYLDGVAHDTVTSLDRNPDSVRYDPSTGGAPPSPPGDVDFWAVSADGAPPVSMAWEPEAGDWTIVIMNADGAAGVAVDASAAARSDLVIPIGVGLIVVGFLLGAGGTALLVWGASRDRDRLEGSVDAAQPSTAGSVAVGSGRYPALLEGSLDPGLTRWMWLVKWFLAIPHMIVLVFLWVAFAVLTFVAFFAILFTGRYPRGIFEFNVGVLRWSWRVGFYAFSAIGTDAYPPFTLAETDYPARFDVAYPERLSRGLVLVKSWLLAIPHLIIVGILTSGVIWWTFDSAGNGRAVEVGGGLIGILVLIAGLALLFTGRYPQGLYDLIIGLNRWVFRVAAYVALMRDEYPPFRLDMGSTEPPVDPAPSAPSTDSGA